MLPSEYLTVKAPTRRSQQLDSGQRGAIVILVVIWVVSALLVGPILHVRHVHIVEIVAGVLAHTRAAARLLLLLLLLLHVAPS